MNRRRKIGELLVEAGVLTDARLAEVLALPRPTGMKLGQYLVREGLVREADLVAALSRQLEIPVYQPDEFPVDHELAKLLPPTLAS